MRRSILDCVLCVCLLLSGTGGALAADGWTVGPYGQTALRSFEHAPYPHASRANGHTYDKKFFDEFNHYNDSTVGIFIPKGFRPSPSGIDFIVHFHGWSNNVARVLDRYRLREQVEASGVNAVLLVPQGPKDAQDSDDGKLQYEPGAFTALLREIATYLKDAGKIQTAEIGRIVVSAHSGGYRGASYVLQIGGLTDHVSDVLLFDAAYGDLQGFSGWLAGGTGRRLVSLFTDDTSSGNVQLISLVQKQNIPFTVALEADLTATLRQPRRTLFIYTADLAHDETMQGRDYFRTFLQTSALCLTSPR